MILRLMGILISKILEIIIIKVFLHFFQKYVFNFNIVETLILISSAPAHH